jgi:glucosamine kinase
LESSFYAPTFAKNLVIMLLIADSGSTKTSWRYVSPYQEIIQAETVGYNPFFQAENEIIQSISTELLPQLPPVSPIQEIYFYGAGCSTHHNILKMQTALKTVFPDALVFVADDMEGAARSLCQREAGIVAILGTGSNSAFYDGEKIMRTVGGLGVWLGDEGSGAYMGKKLLQDFLNEEMPTYLAEKLQKRYELTRANILDNVYAKPYPNRYLAQLSKFLFDHRHEEYPAHIITQCFADFYDKAIAKYENATAYPIHFTGSLAFYFSDFVRRVGQAKGYHIGKIVENPAAGLALFHHQN